MHVQVLHARASIATAWKVPARAGERLGGAARPSSGGATERVGERRAVRRARGLVALAAGVGDADHDPAAVAGAEPARREPVLLEPPDHARERALAEVERL